MREPKQSYKNEEKKGKNQRKRKRAQEEIELNTKPKEEKMSTSGHLKKQIQVVLFIFEEYISN